MAQNSWMPFVLAALATWRITHLLSREDGPADLIVRFRGRLGNGTTGQLMDCFNCLSVFVAAPTALLVSRQLVNWSFVWMAVSGAACLLERLGQTPDVVQASWQSTEREVSNVLRSETIGHAEHYLAGDDKS